MPQYLYRQIERLKNGAGKRKTEVELSIQQVRRQ